MIGIIASSGALISEQDVEAVITSDSSVNNNTRNNNTRNNNPDSARTLATTIEVDRGE